MSRIIKPKWLKTSIPSGKEYLKIKDIVESNKLNTICTSGHCPNIAECWKQGTATFMILGDVCTRACKFCNVKTGVPNAIEEEEPKNVANSIKLMKLKHCVITSVDRDDLPDGGAEMWYKTIKEIKRVNPNTTIEALIPDFQDKQGALEKVISAKPEILSHNLETVERLTKGIRSKAKYDFSLKVLQKIYESGITSKTGIMVGLGETKNEVIQTMKDLVEVNCSIFTIGQYLQPSKKHLPVKEYITPEQFEEYKNIGLDLGLKIVESSPLVRSSYHAEKHV